MDLDKFTRSRPFLYHLTAAANVPRIRESRRLHSASELLGEAGRAEQNSRRRVGLLAIRIGAGEVILRDQDPLNERFIAFEDGWDLARLVEMLNERVFFWPGDAKGPISSGLNHFRRYESAGEPISILRVPTASLLQANPDNPPQFCKYNSGAPGSRNGSKIPRGADTFQPSSTCSFTASEVKEVAFVGSIILPGGTEIRDGSSSQWNPF